MSFSVTYRSCSPETREAVKRFLKDWSEGQLTFTVQTSGSTGKPKSIELKREQLEVSAKRTLRYFDLQPGDTALLGISPLTIGGKMMIVRALLGDLKLIVTEPSSNLLAQLEPNETIAFAPLVPLQLKILVEQFPEQLQQLQTILLGGAPLSSEMEQRVSELHSRVFMGFGMTETVSHIALRKIGSPVYEALEGVSFETSNDALVVTDRLLDIHQLQTNDSVRLLNDHQFEWLGRTDFVINSGGVKIHPEQVEQVISTVLKDPFFIASQPDITFGEQCIIVVDATVKPIDLKQLQLLCAEKLGKYAIPKKLLSLPMIYATGGKINRKATLAQLDEK